MIGAKQGHEATYTELASAFPQGTGNERETGHAGTNIPQPSPHRAPARLGNRGCFPQGYSLSTASTAVEVKRNKRRGCWGNGRNPNPS